MKTAPKDIDAYIASFPTEVQKLLIQIRTTIRKAAPAAQETIKYQIPTYVLNGNLIYFAAYKNHISVYPAPRGSKEFEAELTRYDGGKGTVRFPIDQPIPHDLIRRIVKFRIKAGQEAAQQKENKSKK
jgi:ribonuclease Z